MKERGKDKEVTRWLQNQVAPRNDAMKADPSSGVSIDDAFGGVRAHHEARLKDQK